MGLLMDDKSQSDSKRRVPSSPNQSGDQGPWSWKHIGWVFLGTILNCSIYLLNPHLPPRLPEIERQCLVQQGINHVSQSCPLAWFWADSSSSTDVLMVQFG